MATHPSGGTNPLFAGPPWVLLIGSVSSGKNGHEVITTPGCALYISTRIPLQSLQRLATGSSINAASWVSSSRSTIHWQSYRPRPGEQLPTHDGSELLAPIFFGSDQKSLISPFGMLGNSPVGSDTSSYSSIRLLDAKLSVCSSDVSLSGCANASKFQYG